MKNRYLTLVAVTLAATTSLAACAPSAAPEPSAPAAAPATSEAPSEPSPEPTYITPSEREEVAVEAARDGLATSIDWDDLLDMIDRQETPVITGLVAAPGATLTLVGSSEVVGFSPDGSMEIAHNADGDAVFSPRIGTDGSVEGAGGFATVDLDGVHYPVLIRVIAIDEAASE